MPGDSSRSENSSDEYLNDLFAGFDFDVKHSKSERKKAKAAPKREIRKQSGSFRVIHTADWHLGKTLCGLSREEEHDRFLSFLLHQIQELEVNALIVAGDIFDSSNPPQSALRRYYQFLSDLYRSTDCQVVVIGGNHDSPLVLDAPIDVLKTLRVSVIGELRENPEDALICLPSEEAPQLVVAAVPFLRDRDLRTGVSGQKPGEIRAALRAGIKKCYDDIANESQRYGEGKIPILATGHLTISGGKLSDSEREIHIGGLGNVRGDIFSDRFSYVALGHLHRPQVADANGRVRYSGSPIPLSFSESEDKKEIVLLEFSQGNLENTESIPIPVWRSLATVSSLRLELEATLSGFKVPESELRPWVELKIEDPVSNENIFERVQACLGEHADYDVLRVISERTEPVGALIKSETDSVGEEELEGSILETPGLVFRERLEREESLSESEKEDLEHAFAELVELHREHEAERSRNSS